MKQGQTIQKRLAKSVGMLMELDDMKVQTWGDRSSSVQSEDSAGCQQPMAYKPPEGKTLSDIEKSWAVLERAEHERERALQEALLRLENLEQLAQNRRRLEALSTDALAREPRFAALRDMAKTIERGNYHSKEQIMESHRWKDLLQQLQEQRGLLGNVVESLSILRDIELVSQDLKELQ
ncbi:hypothetical protein F7725_008636, partial [Dissostichus mawsoni]